MKVVLLGDLHLISPDDPDRERVKERAHFAQAWPHFAHLARKVREESPDLIISVGDLVDWFSLENRDFAVEQMHSLGLPWVMTPGNHDYSGGTDCDLVEKSWKEAGVETTDRVIDGGDVSFLLFNTGGPDVPRERRQWLEEKLTEKQRHLLITHVPPDFPAMRKAILAVDPDKYLGKYVRDFGAPGFPPLARRLYAGFSGHVHFPARASLEGADFHLLPLSLPAVEREYPGMGAFTVLEIHPHRIDIQSRKVF